MTAVGETDLLLKLKTVFSSISSLRSPYQHRENRQAFGRLHRSAVPKRETSRITIRTHANARKHTHKRTHGTPAFSCVLLIYPFPFQYKLLLASVCATERVVFQHKKNHFPFLPRPDYQHPEKNMQVFGCPKVKPHFALVCALPFSNISGHQANETRTVGLQPGTEV